MSEISEEKQHLLNLIKARDELEQKIAKLQSENVPGALVDEEGFPRADVDVYGITFVRAELAKLQTDHKNAMKEIEQAMTKYHAHLKSSQPQGQGSSSSEAAPVVTQKQPVERKETPVQGTQASTIPADLEPFYIVRQVFLDSPAFSAGLVVDDKVLQFGTVTKANNTPSSIAEVVSHSVGKSVRVVVKRGEDIKELFLTPQQWSGRGLLGCHIVPFPSA